MANVLIIGGGFAGVWAAAGAVRTYREAGLSDSTLRVTLVAPGDDMVIRPRLYEPDPQRMRVPLDRVLGPIGVRRVAATVTGIDVESRTVVAVGRDGSQIALGYDRLVLAAGSRVVRPTIDGAEHLFDVDTMPAAAALHAHVVRLPAAPYEPGRFTAVVVGAGFTGIEVATELVDRLRAVAGARPVRVVLVEQASVVGPRAGGGTPPADPARARRHRGRAPARQPGRVRRAVRGDPRGRNGRRRRDGRVDRGHAGERDH
jgi:NADH dehydrogenase